MFSSQLASCLDIHYHNKRAKSTFLEEILFVSVLAKANEQKGIQLYENISLSRPAITLLPRILSF